MVIAYFVLPPCLEVSPRCGSELGCSKARQVQRWFIEASKEGLNCEHLEREGI